MTVYEIDIWPVAAGGNTTTGDVHTILTYLLDKWES